ncbi:Alpha,alpha-trehalose-phosphate synthase [UDP-forming] [Nosema granulosis]|uniref:Alpha,alpha-trehalose-phosphate synthase [UDP-forming] n=1 Tax=Nosema granulosis TaxID=83296 RepID=A0A9P6H1W5_9MICR|nr:Alpha,alpha-trehalose-phosphate synthase [UDP-forming] [Nosema granulosis]
MKLIVVSNRLPITVKRNDQGFEYFHSSGGLVTGLESIKNKIKFLWFGNISSQGLSDSDKTKIRSDCKSKFNSCPVFIDPKLNHDSYNGFCNAVLWPMLHHFIDDVNQTNYNYEAYMKYNEIFCEKISEIAKEGDIIWVHDYHLMALPKMLRERWGDKVKIMFFLHTPFPTEVALNTLKCRKEILASLNSSDLVSFHSYEYVLNYIQCCHDNKLAEPKNIDAVPIGIDPTLFTECLKKPETQDRIRYFLNKFDGKHVVLGVDRTDYIKGIPQRMIAFKNFLNKYEKYRDNTVMLQIAVPSRMDVKEYQSYVGYTNELVADVNSTIGNVDDNYIYLLNNSVDFPTLCALYYISDVLLITSLRDGMNLVAMEYIACQEENQGIIVLSELTGVATTLPGSITMNAWTVDEITESLHRALELSPKERKTRFKINSDNVYKFTSYEWAENNLDKLCDDWREILTTDE